MKRHISLAVLLCCLLAFVPSCEKAPLLVINTPSSISFTEQGGTQKVSFTANRDWSVSSSESWCKVSPSSGLKSDGELSFTVTCDPNTTYDPRNATVTIKADELMETISVTQDTNLGMLVTQTSYNISFAEQTIEVEVKTNVDYSVIITDECKSWISLTDTKSLSLDKLMFRIKENTTDDIKQGVIEVKQNNGLMSSRIEVLQTPLERISADSQFSCTVFGGSLSIPILSNTEMIATTQNDWINVVETKGTSTHQLLLSIDPNTNSTSAREGTVSVVGVRGESKTDISVVQDGAEEGVFYTTRYGELGSLLSSYQTDTITTLTIKGYLDSLDFVTLRQLPQLKTLDIYDVICESDRIPSGAFCYINTQNGNTNQKYSASAAKIKHIAFPKGLKTIGEFAFYHSESLIGQLVLPESLETIEAVAFGDCVLLNGLLKLPESLKYIGESAFQRCSFSGALLIPSKVEYIGNSAFQRCESFTSLKLSENLKYLGGESFNLCTGLRGDLIIPEGLEAINWRAFYGCPFWGDLTLPASLREVGYEAFYQTGFSGVLNLPDGLEVIGFRAFANCGFDSIIIPSTVKTWGEYCFSGCSNLKGEIVLPENMTKIPKGLFSSCSKLSSIVFPKNVTIIGSSAFYECSGFSGTLEIPEGVVLIESFAFNDCGGGLEKIILPNSLQTIQEYGMNAGRTPIVIVKWDDPIPYTYSMLRIFAEVQVPNASLSKYQNAEGWKYHQITGY